MKPSKLLLILSSGTLGLVALLIIYISIVTSDKMPSLQELENPTINKATRIYAADGELLDHFFIERRVPLKFNEIPSGFINALVGTEDRKYWDHWGVNASRVFTAALKNIMYMRSKEGAGTITMQLARNLFHGTEHSLNRKIREAVTAVQIEKTYTKEEIIELYTNKVAFGRSAYGLQVASKAYFDKTPKELSLSQCAFLVGLLKKPEFYSRKDNLNASVLRRNVVLEMMVDAGFITESQAAGAKNEPLEFAATGTSREKFSGIMSGGIAPHFIELIRQDLGKDSKLSDYDLYRDGLAIHTSLDSRIQKSVNKALDEYMPEIQKLFDENFKWSKNLELLDKVIKKAILNRADYRAADENGKKLIADKLRYNAKFIDSVKNAVTTVQVGVVVMDPATGGVLAMAGASPKFMKENPDAKYSLNHAAQIKRQPGSSFKPFVYASSLMKGLTPGSMVECGPYTYTLPSGETWSPHGSSGDEGERQLTLTQALTRSINTVSARLITQVTSPGDVAYLAGKMGIKSKLLAVPALSLGAGGEVDPLEMTNAYCTFATGGVHVDPYLYTSVEAPSGEVIVDKKMGKGRNDVFDKGIAQQMTVMMQSVVTSGTASRIKQYLKDVDAAGKTGTTNDAADAWFVGYTPQLACGIWVGFDELKITFDCLGAVGYGGRVSAPLWGKIMGMIYADPQLTYKQKRFAFSVRDTNAPATDEIAPENNEEPVKEVGAAKTTNPTPTKNKDNGKDNMPLAKREEPMLAPLPKQKKIISY